MTRHPYLVSTSRDLRVSSAASLVALLVVLAVDAFAQAGVTWTEANANIPWGGRNGHASVVFNNKMWVLGGFGLTGTSRGSDVWSSSDGITWTMVTPAAPWGGRQFHTALVYNNLMWVIGGEQDIGTYYHDVWSSPDGFNWTLVTNSASWVQRGYHMSVVFGGKMWVIGGLVSTGTVSDAWFSTDGQTWNLATNSMALGFRSRAVPFVYGSKIWLAGGNGSSGVRQNDIWNSGDGITWTQVTAAAAWPARNFHAGVVYNGKMWIMGGETSVTTNDVWSSTNGIDWTQATPAADWAPRYEHTCLSFNNKMWVIAGFGVNPGIPGNTGTEVWYSGTASLRGTVVDAATDAPLECASIRVFAAGVERLAFADKNGEYRLDDLENGTYTVETFSPGYAKRAQSLAITTPAVYYQNLPLDTTSTNGSVHGQVTDAATGKPLAGVKVAVVVVPVGASTITCADGRYELPHVAAKNVKDTTVTLQYAAANYTTQNVQVTVPAAGSAQQDVPMAKSAVFPGAVSGTVTNVQTNAAIANAEVTVVGSGGITTTTDPSGVYQLSALPPDIYTIQASATGYAGDSQLVDATGPDPALADFALASQGAVKQGDVNGDAVVDAIDVQLVINQALGIQTGYDCDINKDASVNAVDVQLVINAALGVVKYTTHLAVMLH